MLSTFYKNYSVHLLLIVALSFPVLLIRADSIPSNNDIETWLPKDTPVRTEYEQFKEEFGAEELILIGLSTETVDERLVEAVCERVERVAGIRKCWSPERLREVMQEIGVSEQKIQRRLEGFAVSKKGNLIGLIALLSPEGLKNRSGTVEAIRKQLNYCQLDGDKVVLSGAPVIVTELDRLGSRANNQTFFQLTLLISLCLLYYTLRQWKPAFAILGLTVWAINLTLSIIAWAGGEMNFILGALSVMVMVFTLAISIHFLHYYTACSHSEDPVNDALGLAWKPCFLATLTTTIGLISLTVSDIAPVRQFGYAASIGSVVALLTGLGITPALLTLWPQCRVKKLSSGDWLAGFGHFLLTHRKRVAFWTCSFVCLCSIGLFSLKTKIDPLDFLPQESKVLNDVHRIEENLTTVDSIEAVVDFRDQERPFFEKLNVVRRLEEVIQSHPEVHHTMSVASFFPEQLPASPFARANLLKDLQARQKRSEFISAGGQLWRISARVSTNPKIPQHRIFDELKEMTQGSPITITGMAPLVEQAQLEIFGGFWESFTMAFAIITLVMIVSLKSIKTGMLAMIPNLTPVGIVFGILGWFQFPIDIGMMMTGSIALGIAVDGTFHFLVRYQEDYNREGNSFRASRNALWQTGAPIFKAAIISSIGMLALTMSNFAPTVNFGYMMATLLMAALIGDLIVLPTLLALRPSRRRIHSQPKFRAKYRFSSEDLVNTEARS